MALTKVTGQVINDSTGLVVGVTTVGGGLSATNGFFSGIVTAVGDASFSGNVSVGGTLTYEDVTNIDAVGLITARSGVKFGASGTTVQGTSTGIGIGTDNPRTNFQVGAFGGGDSNIQLATGTSGTSNILFGDGSSGSDYYKGFIKYNHSTDNLELYTTNNLIHYTGGSERLRIDSSGN